MEDVSEGSENKLENIFNLFFAEKLFGIFSLGEELMFLLSGRGIFV